MLWWLRCWSSGSFSYFSPSLKCCLWLWGSHDPLCSHFLQQEERKNGSWRHTRSHCGHNPEVACAISTHFPLAKIQSHDHSRLQGVLANLVFNSISKGLPTMGFIPETFNIGENAASRACSGSGFTCWSVPGHSGHGLLGGGSPSHTLRLRK